jgi:hypothetical protein
MGQVTSRPESVVAHNVAAQMQTVAIRREGGASTIVRSQAPSSGLTIEHLPGQRARGHPGADLETRVDTTMTCKRLT